MKKRIFSFGLFLSSLTAFPFTIEAGKDTPSYEIKKVSKDAALADSEAVVVFTCYEYESFLMKNQGIVFAFDKGENINITTNEEGVFVAPMKPGKHLFEIAAGYHFEEILIPDLELKAKTKTEIILRFKEDPRNQPMKKPVIYFYPTTDTEMKVQLDVKSGLDFTYPAYDKEWKFTAHPNGDLRFGEKTYGYLFWEGKAKMTEADLSSKEGFVVSKDNLVPFFENRLEAMGLNAHERADFIIYWAPLMSKNEQCFIHFLFKEELEKYAPLSMEPAPDELFRVFMLWRPVRDESETAKITAQKLPSTNRKGFTVIEWGGTEMVPVQP